MYNFKFVFSACKYWLVRERAVQSTWSVSLRYMLVKSLSPTGRTVRCSRKELSNWSAVKAVVTERGRRNHWGGVELKARMVTRCGPPVEINCSFRFVCFYRGLTVSFPIQRHTTKAVFTYVGFPIFVIVKHNAVFPIFLKLPKQKYYECR